MRVRLGRNKIEYLRGTDSDSSGISICGTSKML